MKLIIENNVVMNQRGTVKILPEEPDDVWFVYNLISPGDVIIAATTRNVKYSSRVRLSLEISITGVNYHRDSSTLRVHGTTLNTNQHVKKGLFHTVEIELNKEFEIYKVWDTLSIEKLPRGFKNAAGADLAVVLLQPTGFAQLYLLGARQTKLCARVETHSNPNKYFENIFRAFVKHVDLSVVRCVVIGSEGNAKDEFRRFMIAEANRLKVKSVENNKQRIVVFNTRNRGTKGDTATLACMSVEIGTRYKYIGFVESVKKAGGKAFVFSSKHVSGEELANLTGIAAILRFPLPDLDEMVS
ncbi:hypothetical protein ACLB2K_065737 [Fragaria x ananassa]